jgi:hypothetical protein
LDEAFGKLAHRQRFPQCRHRPGYKSGGPGYFGRERRPNLDGQRWRRAHGIMPRSKAVARGGLQPLDVVQACNLKDDAGRFGGLRQQTHEMSVDRFRL